MRCNFPGCAFKAQTMDRMTKHLVKLHGDDTREVNDLAFVTKENDPLLSEPKPREVYHETIVDETTGQKLLR